MPVEVRPYGADDLRPFLVAAEIPFAYAVRDEYVRDHERILERDRLLCAYDGDAIVGTAAALSFRLTVPGAEVPAAGVTEVGVIPSHRRRGILTSMMARLLAEARARDEPVAVLWASEAAIYPRFGYGLATLDASFDLPGAARALRPAPEPGGHVRLVDVGEAGGLLPRVFEAARTARPGFVTRTAAWWELHVLREREQDREGLEPTFAAVHEGEDGPEGYVRYRMRHAWETHGHENVLEVRELIAATGRAERALWRFALEMDLVGRIRAHHQPADSPLLLLLAEPRRLGFTVGDGLFVRLVDLAGALSGRRYAAAGSVVLDVADAGAPWNEGRWRLAVDGDVRASSGPPLRGVVERTDDPADIALDVTDLGCCYLGGFTFGELVRAGRAVEGRPGAVGRADALFAVDRAPWCPEEF